MSPAFQFSVALEPSVGRRMLLGEELGVVELALVVRPYVYVSAVMASDR